MVFAVLACSSLSMEEKTNIARTWMLENCPGVGAYTGDSMWPDRSMAPNEMYYRGVGSVSGRFRIDPATHKVTVLRGNGGWCKD
jgi:hypothetical protein